MHNVLIALVVVWLLLLALHTVYSYRFMCRTHTAQPLNYGSMKPALSMLELVATVALGAVLLLRGEVTWGIVVLAAFVAARAGARRAAYEGAVAERMSHYRRSEKLRDLDPESLRRLARQSVDMDIEHGARR